MIGTSYLLTTVYILFYALIGLTVIALSLVVAIAILLSKSKKQ